MATLAEALTDLNLCRGALLSTLLGDGEHAFFMRVDVLIVKPVRSKVNSVTVMT
jgi:hypothetical protein